MMERVKLVLKICSITKFSSLNKLINAFCKKEILNKMICELFSKYWCWRYKELSKTLLGVQQSVGQLRQTGQKLKMLNATKEFANAILITMLMKMTVRTLINTWNFNNFFFQDFCVHCPSPNIWDEANFHCGSPNYWSGDVTRGYCVRCEVQVLS